MDVKRQAMLKRLLKLAAPVGREHVDLKDCWRRVLAEDAVAPTDFPPFDRAGRDGFAVRAGEVAGATPQTPVLLREAGDLPAGRVAREGLAPGTAVRVTTGAAMPPGATGVVPDEDAEREAGLVLVLGGAGAARNVYRQGEEIRRGATALPAGTVLDAGAMAALAQLGLTRPLVFVRPRVGILATGSELAGAGGDALPGMTRDSNSYLLCAQVQEAGADPALLGTARDEASEIRARIREAGGCDLVLTTGGVGGGDFDLSAQVLAGLDDPGLDRPGFDRAAPARRGGADRGWRAKPVLAGLLDGRLVIGLTGNPSAVSLSFEEIVRPVLLKMGGRAHWRRERAPGRLAKPLLRPASRPLAGESGASRLLWAHSWLDEHGLCVEVLPRQGGGMLRRALSANSLIALEADSPSLAQGDGIEVILLQPELERNAPVPPLAL